MACTTALILDDDDEANDVALKGSSDPVADSQASYSGWGGIDECCAVEGGRVLALPFSSTYRRLTGLRRALRFFGLGH